MTLYQAKVLVRLRASVLDPAGEAAKSAGGRLGITGINSLRIGKLIEIQIEASSEEEAREKLEILSDRFLANPVIEDWTMEIKPLIINSIN